MREDVITLWETDTDNILSRMTPWGPSVLRARDETMLISIWVDFLIVFIWLKAEEHQKLVSWGTAGFWRNTLVIMSPDGKTCWWKTGSTAGEGTWLIRIFGNHLLNLLFRRLLPIPNVFYGLFPRRTCEIKSRGLVKHSVWGFRSAEGRGQVGLV